MEAQEFNFEPFYRGDGVEDLEIEFWEDDAETIPWDLTGCQGLMQLKNGGKVVFTFKTGATHTDSTSLMTIALNIVTLKGFNSLKIPSFNYAYDLRFKRPSGFIETPIEGTIPVTQDVSDYGGFS